MQRSLIKSNIMGYSIIELMVVVSIVAILARVAIPNYARNVRKAQIINVINFLEGFKPQISEYIMSKGVCPSQIKFGTKTIPAGGSVFTPTAGMFQGDPIANLRYFAITAGFNSQVPLCQVSARVNLTLGNGYIDIQIMTNPTTNLIETYCGFWHPNETVSTLQYMPQTCNRTDLHTVGGY